MEKIKLIILLFSLTVFSQSDSAINDDFKSIEKIADSLFKNKNFMEATNYYEKLVKVNDEHKPIHFLEYFLKTG